MFVSESRRGGGSVGWDLVGDSILSWDFMGLLISSRLVLLLDSSSCIT